MAILCAKISSVTWTLIVYFCVFLVKMLNQTCDIGIRSSFSAEETCCHESFIEKEDTPTIPSTG